MNVAAFAVVIARERVSETGDDLKSFEGLGQASPLLAWPMTIAMLALAGFPATAGLHREVLFDRRLRGGRLRLARRADRGRLDDLAGLLPARGRRDVDGRRRGRAPDRQARCGPVGGWSPEADARAQPEVAARRASLCAAATIFFGIVPSPLFDLARDVATSFSHLV